MIPGSRLVAVLMFVASTLTAALSQDKSPEFHLTEDVARSLYRISSFAHGHRHGYEEGFRYADMAIHLGAQRREIKEGEVPRSMGYKREFGDKKRFRQGFIYGFIAGYNDSFGERTFRLPEWAKDLPPLPSLSDLPQSDTPLQLDTKLQAAFEEGVIQGYRQGLATAGEEALEDRALAAEAARSCSSADLAHKEGYCLGFTQGFLLASYDRLHSAPADRDLARQIAPAH